MLLYLYLRCDVRNRFSTSCHSSVICVSNRETKTNLSWEQLPKDTDLFSSLKWFSDDGLFLFVQEARMPLSSLAIQGGLVLISGCCCYVLWRTKHYCFPVNNSVVFQNSKVTSAIYCRVTQGGITILLPWDAASNRVSTSSLGQPQ